MIITAVPEHINKYKARQLIPEASTSHQMPQTQTRSSWGSYAASDSTDLCVLVSPAVILGHPRPRWPTFAFLLGKSTKKWCSSRQCGSTPSRNRGNGQTTRETRILPCKSRKALRRLLAQADLHLAGGPRPRLRLYLQWAHQGSLFWTFRYLLRG